MREKDEGWEETPGKLPTKLTSPTNLSHTMTSAASPTQNLAKHQHLFQCQILTAG
jgi:hypothetical protein